MARLFQDTQSQNFWKESIGKEDSARILWFNKRNGDSTKVKSRTFEVFRRQIESNKPTDNKRLPPISAEPRFNRKKADWNEPMGLDRAETLPVVSVDASKEMRPVSPGVKDALYDGFTKEGKGRYIYLQMRYDKTPEMKYAYPTCSSWEYGWKLGDVVKKEDIKKPRHGRNRIVNDTFYTRNGIKIDNSQVH